MRTSPTTTAVRTVIGLDIGGSKTHGIKLVDGAVVADRLAGSANTQNVSKDAAAHNLANLLRDLHADEAEEVVIGAGGVDTDGDKAALLRLVAPHVQRATVTIVHDTRLILAAAAVDTGIAVIAGTAPQSGASPRTAQRREPEAGATFSETKGVGTGWLVSQCATLSE